MLEVVSGMRVNIILPYNTWSGGIRSTYELANHLAARGDSVEIYCPFLPYLEGNRPLSLGGLRTLIRGLGRSIVRWNRVPWFNLKVPFKIVPVCSDRFIRDADVVVANHWPTAYSVARLSSRKGRKFHFIRDTEPWAGQERLVAGSYRLPMSKIVTSQRLKDYLENEVGVEVVGTVPNGVDMKLFGVPKKRHNEAPVVCMMYHTDPRKGIPDGLNTLAAVKERYPQVNFLMFGWMKPGALPIEAEFHLRPVKERLRSIYARSDIFLAPALREGWNNTPMEAMAAGCAVVATDVGGIPYYTIPGETALVVEPGDVGAMVEAISGLIENPERIHALGRRAVKHIQQFTWEKSTAKLATLLAS